MQIFRTLAGYSLGRADIVRRAMSKKKKDVMEKERQIFIYGLVNEKGETEVEGCIRRGVDEQTAKSVFGEMESFASYAFNKSHAAAYASISFMTAWYKYYYPKEYMAALLTSLLENSKRLPVYTAECLRLGIKVLPPHVNISNFGFTVHGDDIRFGLLAIKNLGTAVINEIVSEREKGEFRDFYDFCKRLHGKGMNSRALESLIKCGALDNLGFNRREMLSGAKQIMDGLDTERRNNLEGQLSFFDNSSQESQSEYNIVRMSEFPITELLAMEKEMAGMYLSGHPLMQYEPFISSSRCDKLGDIIENSQSYDGKKVRAVAIISSVKLKTTKNNTVMAFVNIEDMTGGLEMLVFPQTLSEYGNYVSEGNVLEIFASVNAKEDEEPKLLCDRVRLAPKDAQNSEQKNQPVQNVKKPKRLYIRLPSKKSREYEYIRKLLAVFDGRTPVSLYYSDEKKYEHLPFENNTDVNDVIFRELERVLGEGAVVFK